MGQPVSREFKSRRPDSPRSREVRRSVRIPAALAAWLVWEPRGHCEEPEACIRASGRPMRRARSRNRGSDRSASKRSSTLRYITGHSRPGLGGRVGMLAVDDLGQVSPRQSELQCPVILAQATLCQKGEKPLLIETDSHSANIRATVPESYNRTPESVRDRSFLGRTGRPFDIPGGFLPSHLACGLMLLSNPPSPDCAKSGEEVEYLVPGLLARQRRSQRRPAGANDPSGEWMASRIDVHRR